MSKTLHSMDLPASISAETYSLAAIFVTKLAAHFAQILSEHSLLEIERV